LHLITIIQQQGFASKDGRDNDEDDKKYSKKGTIFRIGMAQNFLMIKWLKEIKNV
jgi:hypothetical protein